ncbi:MAG: four helix bundle protein [Bacteroidaceae bacterium]|nr:four helix bundle protein [Bacteroidaceae bacterium]
MRSRICRLKYSRRVIKAIRCRICPFLRYCIRFTYEVETQLLISHKIGYIDAKNYDSLNQIIISIERQITGLIKTIRQ